MEIKTKLDDKEIKAYLAKLLKLAGTLQPYFVSAAATLDMSVMKNFRQQGRPTRWTALSPLTKAIRTAEGTLKGSPILQRMGTLRQSIGTEIREIQSNALLYGTKQVKAGLLQYGGTIKPKKGKYLTIPFPGVTGRARDYKKTFVRKGGRVIYEKSGKGIRPLFMLLRSVTIPPRPYLMFQEEDIKALSEMCLAYVMDIERTQSLAK